MIISCNLWKFKAILQRNEVLLLKNKKDDLHNESLIFSQNDQIKHIHSK
jgi:hypothetical protein